MTGRRATVGGGHTPPFPPSLPSLILSNDLSSDPPKPRPEYYPAAWGAPLLRNDCGGAPVYQRDDTHTWEAYAAVEHTSDADLMNERVPPIPLPITHAADERRRIRHEGRDSRAIDHGEPTPCDYCNRYNTQTRLSLTHPKEAATVHGDIVLAGDRHVWFTAHSPHVCLVTVVVVMPTSGGGWAMKRNGWSATQGSCGYTHTAPPPPRRHAAPPQRRFFLHHPPQRESLVARRSWRRMPP